MKGTSPSKNPPTVCGGHKPSHGPASRNSSPFLLVIGDRRRRVAPLALSATRRERAVSKAAAFLCVLYDSGLFRFTRAFVTGAAGAVRAMGP